MLEFEELRLELEGLKPEIKELSEALGIEGLKEEVKKLEKLSAAPDFWDDMQNSQKILQRISNIKNKIFLNLDFSFANPKAVNDAVISVPTTQITVIKNVFKKYLGMRLSLNTYR